MQMLAKFFETVLTLLRRDKTAPLWQITKLLIHDLRRPQPLQVHAWWGNITRTSAPKFSVHLINNPDNWARCKISEVAIRALASEHLEDLTINDTSFRSREWAMLERIPGLKLRAVETMGGAAVSLLDLLTRQSEQGNEDSGSLPPPTPFIPTLLSLTVRSMSTQDLPFSQLELPRLLAQRAAAGARLKEFRVDSTCGIHMSMVQAWQAACPELAITSIDAGRWEAASSDAGRWEGMDGSCLESEEDETSSDDSESDDSESDDSEMTTRKVTTTDSWPPWCSAVTLPIDTCTCSPHILALDTRWYPTHERHWRRRTVPGASRRRQCSWRLK
ncbi:hypothetical protein FA95DRAFT_124892 [Auriscalpium vulgare]|uniref:Uncharacterized protein n=1 Tax=Auriscalpium vulgare TaxID=40419 RepID=A0ACB8RP80_9AGAM|nr:hypothetical protein FA95DRAFT_124892 [Auriscalpium vulgare]